MSDVLTAENPYIENTRAAIERAEASGFTVVKREPHTLLIDLDSTSVDDFKKRVETFRSMFKVEGFEVWESKTPGHHHALVTLRKPVEQPLEAVALQAALGSDIKRELAAIWDIRNNNPDFSILFKPTRVGK